MHTQYRRAGGFVKRKRDLVQHGGGHAAQHADEQRPYDQTRDGLARSDESMHSGSAIAGE